MRYMKIAADVFKMLLTLTICLDTSSQLQAFTSGENDTIKKVSPEMHHEIPEGEYLKISLDEMHKTPAYRDDGSNYFTIQANTTVDGNNIIGDAANEPSIAIDPTNPDKMVIGWRQFDTQQNNFRQAGYAYSLDEGETWTFPGVIDPGVFRSDPVLAADSDGNIYYNSLTVLDGDMYCDVYIMPPGSTEWEEVTYALGGDKQWMVIDNTNLPSSGNIYAFWKAQFSVCENQNFTRSLDNGSTFEDCSLLQSNPTRGTLAIGPDGELYACGGWGNTHLVSKSISASSPQEVIAWEQETVVDLKGTQALYAGPNPSGMLGQVCVAVLE